MPVLSPAAEYELARRIGIMEEVLWVQILSLAPLTPHILAIIEETLGKAPPESPAVLKAAAELGDAGQSSGKTLSQAAGPLPPKTSRTSRASGWRRSPNRRAVKCSPSETRSL